MIPLRYRLRAGVRVIRSATAWHAVCALPLTVLRTDARVARLLAATAGGAGLAELACDLGVGEERALRLCEYLRGRGLLDVELDPSFSYTPTVTVIVPVRDRADDLAECLAALDRLDYPSFDVVVVDDGSADDARAVAMKHSCTCLTNATSKGQSFCRNLAASGSRAEILAFTDSDCVVDPQWLRELVPYFLWSRVSAVGGRVDGFFSSSLLDRYEATASPLSMGRRYTISLDDVDTSYVPTCNLLVRRERFLAVGGLRDDLCVGEDVDLCWRLRAAGGVMLYTPHGAVRHKHRNRWPAMLERRALYGTSEAILFSLHSDKRKRILLPALPTLSFGIVLVALLLREARFVPLVFVPLVIDTVDRLLRLHREGAEVPSGLVGFSVLRRHLSLVHSLFFLAVRYYLIALALLSVFVPAVRPVTVFAVLYTSVVTYSIQRPRLSYPSFLGCYLLEHGAYQLGVAIGCWRGRTLRPYRVSAQARVPRMGRVKRARWAG